jgi:hypothetical protein
MYYTYAISGLLLPIEILQVRTSSLADHIPYWLQAGEKEKKRWEGLVNAL